MTNDNPVGTREALGAVAAGRHPATAQILQHFAWAHLPTHLQAVSMPCCHLAVGMVEVLPDGPELTAGLRKLLEAKDCFVRAALD